ncbi:MAG: pentapeptide repeat-containing protein [Desulfobacterales bacterium]|jgi:hypothetical protein
MKKKNSLKVICLLVTLMFIAAPGSAYTETSHSKKLQSKEWYNHCYQLEKAIDHLKNKIVKLENFSFKSDKIGLKLNEKLSSMAAEIDILQQRLETIRSQNGLPSSAISEADKSRLIIPAGYFYQSVSEFDQYDFSGAYLKRAYFKEAVLIQTNFSRTNLKMSSFYNATLDGVVFSGADLSGADFTGAKMTNVIWGDQENGYAICPDETNAAENGGTCEGEPLLKLK